MKLFSPFNLDFLKVQQEGVFNDLCNIYQVFFVTGSMSDDETYVTSGTMNIPCSIEFNNGRFRQMRDNPQLLILDYDVMLTVSADVPVRSDSDIVLVEKGQFLVSGTFQPSSQPTVTSVVQHIQLKRRAV